MSRDNLPEKSSDAAIDAFLQEAAATPAPQQADAPAGRLLFAMDATASREPTWDAAAELQAEMFRAAAETGPLAVQLAYYRGFGEFKATPWLTDPDTVVRRMGEVRCRAGLTRIARVLDHALHEARQQPVHALVFVGDCMEEDADALGELAGQLGLLNVPAFLFHEGNDPDAARTFPHLAHLTGGACLSFDRSSPDALRDLLTAVAVYATGGPRALAHRAERVGGAAKRLTHQVGPGA